MSILASAGRAKIYATDGTGRDSYVSCNSGGFSMTNAPAPAQRGGTFGAKVHKVSPAHIARGGGQGSPGKSVHYRVNGTGRDSYIHCNQGGFTSNYSFQNDSQAYVRSLRGYDQGNEMRSLRNNARKGMSPSMRDTFIEGQISVRSPKARNQINMLKTHQKMQINRLSMPKRARCDSITDLERLQRQDSNRDSQESPRSGFLRKTTQGAKFPMRKSPSLENSLPATNMSAAQFAKQITASTDGLNSQRLDTQKSAATGLNLTTSNLKNMLSVHKNIDLASPRLRYKPAGIVLDSQVDQPIDVGSPQIRSERSNYQTTTKRGTAITQQQSNLIPSKAARIASQMRESSRPGEFEQSLKQLESLRISNGQTFDCRQRRTDWDDQ